MDKETLAKADKPKTTLYYGISAVWIVVPAALLVAIKTRT
jgi:hypothetical protein